MEEKSNDGLLIDAKEEDEDRFEAAQTDLISKHSIAIKWAAERPLGAQLWASIVVQIDYFVE